MKNKRRLPFEAYLNEKNSYRIKHPEAKKYINFKKVLGKTIGQIVTEQGVSKQAIHTYIRTHTLYEVLKRIL